MGVRGHERDTDSTLIRWLGRRSECGPDKVFQPLSALPIHTSELDADPSSFVAADRDAIDPKFVITHE